MWRYLTAEIKVFTWSKISYQVSNYSPTTGTPSGLGALGQLLDLSCLVSHTRSKPMVWWSVSEKRVLLTLFGNWCKVSCGAGLINTAITDTLQHVCCPAVHSSCYCTSAKTTQHVVIVCKVCIFFDESTTTHIDLVMSAGFWQVYCTSPTLHTGQEKMRLWSVRFHFVCMCVCVSWPVRNSYIIIKVIQSETVTI